MKWQKLRTMSAAALRASGVTNETGGGTPSLMAPPGPTSRAMRAPVTGQFDSTRAALPSSSGKNSVSQAHQVYTRRPSTSMRSPFL